MSEWNAAYYGSGLKLKRRGIYQLLQTVSGMQSERNGKGAGVFRRGI